MKGLNINNDVKISELTQTDNELIRAAIERLLFIGTDEMVGSLDQGSRIFDFFDEPITLETSLAIMEEIKLLINVYEPRIVLKEIGVDLIPLETGEIAILVYLAYNYPDQPKKTEILELVKVHELK